MTNTHDYGFKLPIRFWLHKGFSRDGTKLITKHSIWANDSVANSIWNSIFKIYTTTVTVCIKQQFDL